MAEMWIALAVGLAMGSVALWLLGRSQTENLRQRLAEREGEVSQARQAAEQARRDGNLAEQERAAATAALAEVRHRLKLVEDNLAAKAAEADNLGRLLAQAQADATNAQANLAAARDQHQHRLAELKQDHDDAQARLRREFQQAQEALKAEFQTLAQRILDEKSQSFKTQNKEELDKLLTPYKLQLDSLKQSVEKATQQDSESRGSITTLIQQLQQQTIAVSQQAHNLAEALKGNSQTHGSWGEEMLERLLDIAGLQAGINYDTQVTATIEGERIRPDVVVYLPGDRCVVIDSKVSLLDYEQAVAATNEAEARTAALSRHVASIKRHIKDLSGKPYTDLKRGRTLQYVLMFMPIEPAYLAALEADRDLNRFALQHNILLVSPTFLIPILKLIQNMWEDQDIKKNMVEIAEQGGKLYDKFVGFVEDMQGIGKALTKAQAEHTAAMGKLQGHGGLTGQAERLRKLGIRTKKTLPAELRADIEAEALPAAESTPTTDQLFG